MPMDVRRASGSRKRLQLLPVTNFTGGLNLRSEQFQLASSESPEMCNVDVDRRGGMRLRKAVRYLDNTALATDPKNLFAFETVSGTKQVLANVNSQLHYSTGGSFTSLGLGGTTNGVMQAAEMKELLYVQRNTEQVAVKWDGTTASNLTASEPTWQNDFAAPTGGYMPKAKCIAVHGGFMWVANTLENGTAYPNRVRWSHANRPEDWRANDYVDIDTGNDGDQITAIVPFRDHLLVFKRHSTYAIFGYDWQSFQVVPIDGDVGTPTQQSVVASPHGVYVFHHMDGVWVYDGRQMHYIFEALYPALNDDRIPMAYTGIVQLGWVNNRLWVSVPWETSTTRARTFVYDPNITKGGAWTCYTLGLGPFVYALDLWLSACSGKWRVQKLEQDVAADNFGTVAGEVHIDAYYRTKWFDLGQPALVKRWKRLEAVLMQGQTGDLHVQVFKDWDPRSPVKEFVIAPSAGGTNMVWDVSQWDNAEWAATGDYSGVERGSALGTARAVCLKFIGPTQNVDWALDAFTLKYIPKRVRN